MIQKAEDMNVNQRLKDVWDRRKKELRLTQEKVAEALGYEHQATISQFLNGKAPLNMENTIKFALVLGVKPEEINPEFEEFYQYIRNTGDPEFRTDKGGWTKLTEEESRLLSQFKKLPSNEKDRYISEIDAVVEKYDDLFQELLNLRNQ